MLDPGLDPVPYDDAAFRFGRLPDAVDSLLAAGDRPRAAWVLHVLGRHPEALGLVADDETPLGRLVRSLVLCALDRKDEAREVIDALPFEATRFARLALVSHERLQVRRRVAEILEAWPGTWWAGAALHTLGVVDGLSINGPFATLHTEHSAEALSILEAVLGVWHPTTLFTRARLLWSRRRPDREEWDRLIAAAEQGLGESPALASILASAAWADWRHGWNTARTRRLLERAFELGPDVRGACLLLAIGRRTGDEALVAAAADQAVAGLCKLADLELFNTAVLDEHQQPLRAGLERMVAALTRWLQARAQASADVSLELNLASHLLWHSVTFGNDASALVAALRPWGDERVRVDDRQVAAPHPQGDRTLDEWMDALPGWHADQTELMRARPKRFAELYVARLLEGQEPLIAPRRLDDKQRKAIWRHLASGSTGDRIEGPRLAHALRRPPEAVLAAIGHVPVRIAYHDDPPSPLQAAQGHRRIHRTSLTPAKPGPLRAADAPDARMGWAGPFREVLACTDRPDEWFRQFTGVPTSCARDPHWAGTKRLVIGLDPSAGETKDWHTTYTNALLASPWLEDLEDLETAPNVVWRPTAVDKLAGARWPKLKRLRIEAPSVTARAVDALAAAFPNLEQVWFGRMRSRKAIERFDAHFEIPGFPPACALAPEVTRRLAESGARWSPRPEAREPGMPAGVHALGREIAWPTGARCALAGGEPFAMDGAGELAMIGDRLVALLSRPSSPGPAIGVWVDSPDPTNPRLCDNSAPSDAGFKVLDLEPVSSDGAQVEPRPRTDPGDPRVQAPRDCAWDEFWLGEAVLRVVQRLGLAYAPPDDLPGKVWVAPRLHTLRGIAWPQEELAYLGVGDMPTVASVNLGVWEFIRFSDHLRTTRRQDRDLLMFAQGDGGGQQYAILASDNSEDPTVIAIDIEMPEDRPQDCPRTPLSRFLGALAPFPA